MPDREITLNLKQGGDTDALTTMKEPIYVTQNNKKVFAFKAVVGEFSQKSNALNAADFKDHAIAKITLQSTDQQENKQYKDALNKAEGKTSPFYIAMDAEPANQNWFEVKYEEVFDNRPNLWYYGEGNWFELKSKEVAEIGIYYNGKIDKVDLKDKAKVKYVYYDKDGKKHDLKDTYDIIEVDEYKNGKTTTSVPSGYTKKQIISNKRNKYTYNDKIVIEGTKEGKEAGKIRKYVKTGKKTPLIKISSKDYNNEGVNLKFSLKSDGTRPYIHPNAFACILGAIARVGYKDIVIVGFTSKDNHGFPSKTHVNGKHGDFRYLRKDKTGASLHIDTVEDAKKLDITRQEKLIDAFVKFGWPKFYSYKFELKKEQKEKQLLKKCDHLSGHHHHLHSRQFKVNFK
ncbi:peptidoglycan-binding protein [Tenacibaculum maritimum]|uniref:peptidoglycan-binding protein n=1 Tax=Tenacibaculum maritimum TaxID=107401 RepID=UPI00387629AA